MDRVACVRAVLIVMLRLLLIVALSRRVHTEEELASILPQSLLLCARGLLLTAVANVLQLVLELGGGGAALTRRARHVPIGKLADSRVADLLSSVQLQAHLAKLVSSLSIFELSVVVVQRMPRRLLLVCHTVLRKEVLRDLGPQILVALTPVLLGHSCLLMTSATVIAAVEGSLKLFLVPSATVVRILVVGRLFLPVKAFLNFRLHFFLEFVCRACVLLNHLILPLEIHLYASHRRLLFLLACGAWRKST